VATGAVKQAASEPVAGVGVKATDKRIIGGWCAVKIVSPTTSHLNYPFSLTIVKPKTIDSGAVGGNILTIRSA
jgi:hypothetical protein